MHNKYIVPRVCPEGKERVRGTPCGECLASPCPIGLGVMLRRHLCRSFTPLSDLAALSQECSLMAVADPSSPYTQHAKTSKS